LLREIIGIDPGSTRLKICNRKGEIITDTASVMIFDTYHRHPYGDIAAFGDKARELSGKLPPDFKVLRPFQTGKICHFDGAVALFENTTFKRGSKKGVLKPTAVINQSINATVVEREALCESLMEAGASKVFEIDSPISAAMGAGVDITESNGNMIVNIGGTHTEIAIMSLSNIVTAEALPFSVSTLKKRIRDLLKEDYRLLIGEKTTDELLDLSMRSLERQPSTLGPVVGIDIDSGLPVKKSVKKETIWEVTRYEMDYLISAIRESLEGTQPELVTDILERGIIFAGGFSNYAGFVDYVNKKVEVQIIVPEEPEYLCVRGNIAIYANKSLRPLLREAF